MVLSVLKFTSLFKLFLQCRLTANSERKKLICYLPSNKISLTRMSSGT